MATLHILAGQRAKSQMWAWITNWENEHSWGFMSEHAKETGSDKGLEEQEEAEEGKGDKAATAATSQAAA